MASFARGAASLTRIGLSTFKTPLQLIHRRGLAGNFPRGATPLTHIGLSTSKTPLQLIHRRGLADHHGPPKVACWKMSPSKWKEEHFMIISLTGWGLLIYGGYKLATEDNLHDASMHERHEQWMKKYGKVYKDSAEMQKRFLIFKNNVEYIESFNAAGNQSYTLGANHFADLTIEEMRSSNRGYTGSLSQGITTQTPFQYGNNTDIPSEVDWRKKGDTDIPSEVDWRKKGAVTPIKNQGQCDSCWAFSAIAATEGIHQIATGNLVSLSEQELVDCDGRNDGCCGGFPDYAFEYITKNGGISSEAHYPYKGVEGTCRKTSLTAQIKGYEFVPADNEEELRKRVAKQPVSVCIDSSGVDFYLYTGGIFKGKCGTTLDHAVTIVGYGITVDGTKYWIVKNSWGKKWGEKGYIRMERDIDAKQGLCGIAMYACYPTA